MSSIAIVIVTYQGSEWIRPLLNSLHENSLSTSIIIVDNASNDNTCEIVRNEFPDTTLIALDTNLGFGGGNNVGITHALKAGFEYIFLVNQDGIVPRDTIRTLHDFMNNNREFGIATPVHCSPDDTCLDQKTYTGYLRSYGFEYLSDAALGNPIRAGYRIRGINAAAWFVRADTFRKVGGFDPIFFMYGEDDDLIARFEHHEIPFALVPAARFVHLRQPQRGMPSAISARIKGEARRTRATLLARIKRPGTSLTFAASTLIALGIIQPTAAFILRRDFVTVIAHWIATFQTAMSLKKAFQHKSICENEGHHYLEC
ncbi:MAG: glycosyltransferase family 2 protein [Azoarcus sp.]|nr:glycosyltransferase family 2 protein [Azoarcus sp.]